MTMASYLSKDMERREESRREEYERERRILWKEDYRKKMERKEERMRLKKAVKEGFIYKMDMNLCQRKVLKKRDLWQRLAPPSPLP